LKWQHGLYRNGTNDVHNYKQHVLSVLITEPVGKNNNLVLGELEGFTKGPNITAEMCITKISR
jgi:hypothetical protein